MRIMLYLLVLGLLSACQKNQPITPSGKTFRIGIIAPLQGNNKNQGQQGILGIKVAQQLQPLLNNGDKLELIIEDDQNNPQLSRQALHKLATIDKIKVILIFSGNQAVLAMTDEIEKLQIPVMVLSATHPDIVGNKKFINQFIFDDRFQSEVAAVFIRDELLLERVAIISEAEQSSQFLANNFSKKFQE